MKERESERGGEGKKNASRNLKISITRAMKITKTHKSHFS